MLNYNLRNIHFYLIVNVFPANIDTMGVYEDYAKTIQRKIFTYNR